MDGTKTRKPGPFEITTHMLEQEAAENVTRARLLLVCMILNKLAGIDSCDRAVIHLLEAKLCECTPSIEQTE
jgi:hypothetical protein